MLFFGANDPQNPLALDEEYRAIDTSLQRSGFEIASKLAVRAVDIQLGLLEHHPDIIHFAGHGTAFGELVVLDDARQSAHVSAAALTTLLEHLKGNVKLAVLNACFAAEQATAICEHVGIAIGMNGAIDDRAAIAFSRSFYGSLAYGKSVAQAFGVARTMIVAEGLASEDLVELHERHAHIAKKTHFRAKEKRVPPGWSIVAPLVLVSAGVGAMVHHERTAHTQDRATPDVQSLPGSPATNDSTASRPSVPASPASTPPIPGMVRISGGRVRIGAFDMARRPAECGSSSPREDCTEISRPDRARDVQVATFDMDRTEVTIEAFVAWLGTRSIDIDAEGNVRAAAEPRTMLYLVNDKPCGTATSVIDGRIQISDGSGRLPATCVTWDAANDYCRSKGNRLPLDAEWELAAKGAEGRPFPWGDRAPTRDGVAFDRGRGSFASPIAVGASEQDVTRDGVRDLGGNAREWVQDQMKTTHVLRGGSWQSAGACGVLSSACWFRSPKASPHNEAGFRCARSVHADADR